MLAPAVPHRYTLARNLGTGRGAATCSNPEASLMSTGSLHGAPKNDKPIGRPSYNPAGTVMCGYPAIAAGEEQPPVSKSPFTVSVSHAGPEVSVTIASKRWVPSTASMPLAARSGEAGLARLAVFLAVESALGLRLAQQFLIEDRQLARPPAPR